MPTKLSDQDTEALLEWASDLLARLVPINDAFMLHHPNEITRARLPLNEVQLWLRVYHDTIGSRART